MKRTLCKAILISILGTQLTFAASSEANESNYPAKNGYIVLSVPVKLEALIPSQASNAHTRYILPLVFEPLVTVNSKQELVPVLAKSWVVSSDKKQITINIHPNHYFTDNTEVTASDIVNSITRLCSKDSLVYTKFSGLIGCTEHAIGKNVLPRVYAKGKYDVVFNVNISPSNFLYQLSMQNAVVTKQSDNKLIGSGPYVLENQHGDYVILKKNANYLGNNPAMNPGVIFIYAKNKQLIDAINHGTTDGAIIY